MLEIIMLQAMNDFFHVFKMNPCIPSLSTVKALQIPGYNPPSKVSVEPLNRDTFTVLPISLSGISTK